MKKANLFSSRRIALGTLCLALTILCALVHATPQEGAVKLRLRLIDSAASRDCTGIARLTESTSKKSVPLPGLYDRLRGVKVAAEFGGWHVVPAAGAETTVQRGAYRLEALAGLETQLAAVDLDLTKDAPAETVVKLSSAFDPSKSGFVAGNTHLHLMKLTKNDAEDYLRKIPAADRLRVLFISYLERFKDDAEYITNTYPIGDLPAFKAT